MRKVKFTQDSFDEKLSAILEEFPMLDVRRDIICSLRMLTLYYRISIPSLLPS